MADLKQVVSEWNEFMKLAGERKAENKKWALEIGTFRGKTALGLCKVFDNVVSVDFNKRKISKPKGLVYLVADSHKESTRDSIQKVLGSAKLDLLFIDGDHSYEGVKRDFELYAPLVKSGGIIGLHDIVDSPRHRRKKCDVYVFWDEIKNKYDTSELVHDGSWGGIGIIKVA